MNDQKRNDDKEFKQVVQHFLKTPPRPHKKAVVGAGLAKGDFFAVLNGKLMIAKPVSAADENGSITMDLYRNLDDYRRGVVMEREFRGRL
ncbi:MAG: hypothetical protein R8L07_14965 [Alphaproteobacteria bacterium]|nr:hypothetical protein [Alphaproteobacteria bacterium]